MSELDQQPVSDLEQDMTGHPQVDAVLTSLQRLDELPVADHVAVYEAASSVLRDALTDTGQAPA